MGLDSIIGLPKRELVGPQGKQHPIGDFAIIDDGHRAWLGVPREDELPHGMLRLEPAYAYVEEWPIGPQGQIGRVRAVVPIEQLSSSFTVEVRPTSIVRLTQLDENDRAYFTKMINDAEGFREKLAMQARAARGGIQVARSLPGAPR